MTDFELVPASDADSVVMVEELSHGEVQVGLGLMDCSDGWGCVLLDRAEVERLRDHLNAILGGTTPQGDPGC